MTEETKEPESTETKPPESTETKPPESTETKPPESTDDGFQAKVEAAVKKILGERGGPGVRRVDIEKQAEEMVKAAQQRLAEDEAEKAERANLKEKVEKLEKVVEAPPKKVSKLTKALWGEDK